MKHIEQIIIDFYNKSRTKVGVVRLKHIIKNSEESNNIDISYYLVRKYMRLNDLVGKANGSKGPKRGRNTIIDQINLVNNEKEQWSQIRCDTLTIRLYE